MYQQPFQAVWKMGEEKSTDSEAEYYAAIYLTEGTSLGRGWPALGRVEQELIDT